MPWLGMDRAPIHALSQAPTCRIEHASTCCLGSQSAHLSCLQYWFSGTRQPFFFFLSFPITFYHIRFGPLFHPVKLFWVLKYVPSHPAAESSRHHELLNLPAQRPYREEVRSRPVYLLWLHDPSSRPMGSWGQLSAELLSSIHPHFLSCGVCDLNFSFLKPGHFLIPKQSQNVFFRSDHFSAITGSHF